MHNEAYLRAIHFVLTLKLILQSGFNNLTWHYEKNIRLKKYLYLAWVKILNSKGLFLERTETL